MKRNVRFFKIWLRDGRIDYVAGEYLADAIQAAGYAIQHLARSEEK